MIARIHGDIVEKSPTQVIVDVKGVGYAVALTGIDLDKCKIGEPATLFTYFHVRENSQELFGFTSMETKKLFELLIGVSGVGPKMAMALLGLGDQRQIRQAIASGNTAYISGASGVGKRLAERVVLDLKEKVGVLAGEVIDDLGVVAPVNDEAVEALMSLGYSKSDAITAISKIDVELSTEDKIKKALKEL